ncbi:DUF2511 domain-containing protein [Myroides odoratimimus]|uniref:DUF2511 domain-containing protein n=1 Tax=Myroides odoratimimus TaxID=76832 RepID=UPI002DBEDD2D|nr:DUF2511 domain-containing protein [Myroides odoratimimus]MEC4054400.1 DUF2511 domain-containing protein [Myroides odoratimimus]
MKNRLIFLLIIIAVFVTSCTGKKELIFKKSEYQKEWPFSVDEIEIYCSGYKEIYCKTNDGKIYALNGNAREQSPNNPAINDINEIWLENSEFKGSKIPFTDFIEEGLKLCSEK